MTRREPIREIRPVGLTGEFIYRYWPQIRYLAQYTPDGHAMRVNLMSTVPELVPHSLSPRDLTPNRVVHLVVRSHYQQEPGACLRRWLSVAPQSDRDTELLDQWEIEHWAGVC